MKLQISLEKSFYNLAAAVGKPAVILCDRGLMDSKAFTAPAVWQSILDENGWTEVGLRDRHYDAVIHLVSAAVGAEEFYTLDNNKARVESKEEAALIDEKLQAAWIGHSHLRVIDNSTGFSAKIDRAIQSISRVVGIPEPLEIERKFVVKNVENIPVPHTKIDIIQSYHDRDGQKFRLRSRGRNGTNVYTYTEKKELSPGVRVEIERKISAKEALELKGSSELTGVIEKTRTCFVDKGQYFELDSFLSPVVGLTMLEIELNEIDDDYDIPSFIEVISEVTHDERFSNNALSKQEKKDFSLAIIAEVI